MSSSNVKTQLDHIFVFSWKLSRSPIYLYIHWSSGNANEYSAFFLFAQLITSQLWKKITQISQHPSTENSQNFSTCLYTENEKSDVWCYNINCISIFMSEICISILANYKFKISNGNLEKFAKQSKSAMFYSLPQKAFPLQISWLFKIN